MPREIFISYRRDDDPGMAHALYGHLERAFSEERVFMDVEGGIRPGRDFVRVLEEQVAQCQVMLAMLGRGWLAAADADGRRRLDNPGDYVRIEIESAMRLGKVVIPVLINRTEMPRAEELPESMRSFVRLHAVRITHERLRADARGVVEVIEQTLAEAEQARVAAKQAADAEQERLRREAAEQQQQAEAERLRQEVEVKRAAEEDERRRQQAAQRKAEQERRRNVAERHGLAPANLAQSGSASAPSSGVAPSADARMHSVDAARDEWVPASPKASEASMQPAASAPAAARPLQTSHKRLAQVAGAIAIVAGLAGLAYWQWPAPTTEVATTTRPQIPDRVAPGVPPAPTPAPAGTQQAAQVAQKTVLYEEDPADSQGKRFVGSALWRTETVSPGSGQKPELAVRADVEVPERKLVMSWSLRRNIDKSLPASHTIEITFKLPADFPGGGISEVPGILMKQADNMRGTPLAGLAVKVTTGFFMIGLSNVDADRERNIQLLTERAWLDIPLVYGDKRRAIMAIEKGAPGERAFAEAFKAWSQ
jgi:hypothetical protein